MFVVVGYHTTANLLANGLQLLFDHPAQRRPLVERDFANLPNAFDEMMRFHGPVSTIRRVALSDVVLRGERIAAGDTVVLALLAANRDPAVFDRPDEFRVDRPNATGRSGFTVGPYSCMGQALARLEGQGLLHHAAHAVPADGPGRSAAGLDGVPAARPRAAHPAGAARREAVNRGGRALGDRPRTGRHRRAPALRLDGDQVPWATRSSSRRSSRTSSSASATSTAGSCATRNPATTTRPPSTRTPRRTRRTRRCSWRTGASWASTPSSAGVSRTRWRGTTRRPRPRCSAATPCGSPGCASRRPTRSSASG